MTHQVLDLDSQQLKIEKTGGNFFRETRWSSRKFAIPPLLRKSYLVTYEKWDPQYPENVHVPKLKIYGTQQKWHRKHPVDLFCLFGSASMQLQQHTYCISIRATNCIRMGFCVTNALKGECLGFFEVSLMLWADHLYFAVKFSSVSVSQTESTFYSFHLRCGNIKVSRLGKVSERVGDLKGLASRRCIHICTSSITGAEKVASLRYGRSKESVLVMLGEQASSEVTSQKAKKFSWLSWLGLVETKLLYNICVFHHLMANSSCFSALKSSCEQNGPLTVPGILTAVTLEGGFYGRRTSTIETLTLPETVC